MLATPDVMRCPFPHQVRLTKARAKLVGRGRVTSVMEMTFIKHRVHRVIMMMVMRRIHTTIETAPCRLFLSRLTTDFMTSLGSKPLEGMMR